MRTVVGQGHICLHQAMRIVMMDAARGKESTS